MQMTIEITSAEDGIFLLLIPRQELALRMTVSMKRLQSYKMPFHLTLKSSRRFSTAIY